MRHILPMLIFSLSACCVLHADAANQRERSSGQVRKEKVQAARAVEQTKKQINENSTRTRRSLNRLSNLDAEIKRQTLTIGQLHQRADSLNKHIGILDDSLSTLKTGLTALQNDYGRTLRSVRERRQQMNDFAFVFSASSFTEAWRRLRYLRELAEWNAARARKMRRISARLDSTLSMLQVERDNHAATLRDLTLAQTVLQNKQDETRTLVANLKREGAGLKKELNRRKQRAAELTAELDRIIAEEARRAEEERRRAEEAARRKAEDERRRAEAQAKDKAKPGDKTADGQAAGASTPKVKTPEKQSPETVFAHEAAANRALTGSFAQNKGMLPFPVEGRYNIVSNFGTNTIPGMSAVKINNSGIDIEVPGGSKARAVFEGTVSSIFRLDGFQNIVIVRHGEYLTVYAGLATLTVKKGDKIKAGQTLGNIWADPDDDNRSVLHFEIRREKQKLNPAEWVK